MTSILDYKPAPTIKAFIKDFRYQALFYTWIVGPVGSAKTTALFFKLVYMAMKQTPSPDGVRRTKAVIVRNTLPMLKDTTLASWDYWFKDGVAGTWSATDKIFTLRFGQPGDMVECQVLFRPLDTPDDVRRVLSLEINFAIIDEFVELPKAIVDALSARLGRYRQPDGTPVTIWGMWGSSNPGTEDVWWHDYLHGPAVRRYKRLPGAATPSRVPDTQGDVAAWAGASGVAIGAQPTLEPIASYYHQPGGLSLDAENLENLPGGKQYYLDAITGKSEVWVRQFVDAEWGFSIAGKAVVPGFRADLHVALPNTLTPNPYFPLVVGLDPGITGSAMIVGQQDYDGRIRVFAELIQEGMGAERLVLERLQPLLRNRFPQVQRVIVAADPAAASRTQTDERTVVKVFRRHYEVDVESNNRLPLRLDAIDHYTNTLIEGRAALQIDPSCQILIRALKGGWRYAADLRRETLRGHDPEKNAYSHPGDAFGYMCRYFARDNSRERRYGLPQGFLAAKRQGAPWQRQPERNSYHIR
jgi:hypothetical protein